MYYRHRGTHIQTASAQSMPLLHYVPTADTETTNMYYTHGGEVFDAEPH